MVEMEEERLRMREHVMNEVCNVPLSFVVVLQSETLSHTSLTSQVDSNKDRLVSLQEFLIATNKKEFLEPDSWEVSLQETRRLKSETFYFTAMAVFDSHLCFLASWSDPGAEPGLHRGRDEGV